ncbi:MAG TPA: GntR family transcriptional regulator [Anaeromyxobacter sp.]|nr:GntR family transcriptional regulator [Anaeromyxobacter sp.]
MMSSSQQVLRRPLAGPALAKRIPQYLRVYELLRRRIEDHEYPMGSFLPPEPELVKLLAVSRTTVRKAVEMLIDDGFLVVRRGRGTEILDFRAIQKLQFVTSFSETLREQGFEVTYRHVQVTSTAASRSISEDLNVAEGSRLVLVHRLTLADGKPIAIMRNYLLPDLAPGIEQRVNRIQSLYSFLESEYGISIEAATDFITARAATREQATQLRVPVGSPLLVVRRVTWVNGRPVERAELDIVANRYEYSVRTLQRPGRVA